MNRDLKFRAWDESQKYMAYQGTPDLENIQSFIHHFGDKILMQFTGLLDKNGNEIYEGDVVTHLHSADTCVVVFQKSTAMFLAQEIGDEQMGFGIEDVTEVIGNIHENANLLQGVS